MTVHSNELATRVHRVTDWQRNRKLGWQGYYRRLKEFYRAHGHSNVPQSYPQDPSLGAWVARQRSLKYRNTLSEEQRKQLSEVDFSLELPRVPTWEEYFLRLKEYYRVHGHSNVPQRYPEDPSLGSWVGRQRGTRHRETLTEEQRQKLSEVEFSWELQLERFDRLWNESYEELKEYKARHGNCEVPTLYGRGQPRSLGAWVSMQKRQYHQGLLREDRKRKLNELGFSWEKRTLWGPDRDVDSLEAMWHENYEKLVDFARTYGHTLVPNLFVNGKNECLGRWVRAQRSSYLQKTMPEYRVELLEKVGFVWVVLAKGHSKGESRRVWSEMYARLVKYRRAHGDCQVPIDYAQDAELARWVDEQRSHLKDGSIFPSRIERLDAIGFLMTKEDYAAYWIKQFKNLVDYQTKHKTTRICHTSEGRLLRWTTAQRYLYRFGLLSTERKEMLQSIGFDWRSRSRLYPKGSTVPDDDGWDEHSDDDSVVDVVRQDTDCDRRFADSLGREAPLATSEAAAESTENVVVERGPRKKRRLEFHRDVGMALGRPKRHDSELSEPTRLSALQPCQNVNGSKHPGASPHPPLQNRRGTGGCEPDVRTEDNAVIHEEQPDSQSEVESSFHEVVVHADQCPELDESTAHSTCELADDMERERVPCSYLYPIGTRVRKHYDGYGWVSGEIARFEGVYRVHYDDGDEEDFLHDDVQLAAIVSQADVSQADVTQKGAPVAGSIFPMGTPVYKFFEGYGWFSGHIIAFDGVYLIRHDDGDEEELFYDSPEVASIVANAKQASSRQGHE